MELGLYSFAERISDPHTGATLSPEERVKEVLEEIELADQVGLDVYGLGEHHREDFVASSPAMVLAAAASRSKSIRLSSAVTVISSADPVRVFEDFSTLDLISGGRAEIMVGRGSFVESFPLFGYDLADYDELFEEKLELLLELNRSERVTWTGQHRATLRNQAVHPRPAQDTLPVWVGVGGTPSSAARAGRLGLPLALGIIGGDVRRFAPLLDLYREEFDRAGHDRSTMRISVNAHGFVADTTRKALDLVAPYTVHAMQRFLRLPASSLPGAEHYRLEQGSPSGALVAGTPEEVAEKIIYQQRLFGLDRYLLQLSVGTLPHREVMRAIELLGTRVAPLVRAEAQPGPARPSARPRPGPPSESGERTIPLAPSENPLPSPHEMQYIAYHSPDPRLPEPSRKKRNMAASHRISNVVLVHGAFADGSGWRGVYDLLTDRGFRVSIVQNPLTSLDADVAATNRVLDQQDGPAILVGHSWGGTVITQAGSHPNVAGLVYVSALIPDVGETSAQQYEGFAATPEFVIDIREDGFGYLARDHFRAGFAADIEEKDASFLADSQVPVNMAVFGEAVTAAAWRDKPSWAVIATEDKAFDQAMLQHMATRIGARITDVPGSHALFISQAETVSDVIASAAENAH